MSAERFITVEALRRAFLARLTADSETQDRRRRDFNQAIFDADEGWAVFTRTDLPMIMVAFDASAKEVQRREPLGWKPLADAAPCCDYHGPTCEPPSELCCEKCSEHCHGTHQHGRQFVRSHHDGSRCVLDA